MLENSRARSVDDIADRLLAAQARADEEAKAQVSSAKIKRTLRKIERESGTGATGATILKLTRTPIVELVERKLIGPVELQAAIEIEDAFMAISGALILHRGSLERIDKGVHASWTPTVGQVVERYRAWAEHWSVMAKRGAPMLSIAIAAIVDQRPLRVIDADVGIRRGRAAKALVAMLRDYAARAKWADSQTCQRWIEAAERFFVTYHPALRSAMAAARTVGESG